jgi:uncharacterized membrane protein (UPF0182 family)
LDSAKPLETPGKNDSPRRGGVFPSPFRGHHLSALSGPKIQGTTQYISENIPRVSNYGLTVDRPAIYYGEKTPGYRIVATQVKEFDYPKGSQNVYTSYQGKGGIPLDSYWRRVLFAWNFSDVNILFTSYLVPESRIQIWRRVQERVGRIAPFCSWTGIPTMS